MSSYKNESDPDQTLDYSPLPGYHVRISRTNEIWQGKNDPTERRRIQNRINQRAFRSRQRAGEQPKATKAKRSSTSRDASESDSNEGSFSDASPRSPPAYPIASPPRSDVKTSPRASASRPNATQPAWDELGQLINRNFVAATIENARVLGLDGQFLGGGLICTPQIASRTTSAALAPVRLQYEMPHDPIIDTIPHARFRFNILRAIAAGTLDQTAFTQSLRKSGMLRQLRDSLVREGLVIWGTADNCANWEMSDLFFRQWSGLLEGCDDFIAHSNAWRAKRGFKPFPLSTIIKQE